MKLYFFVIFLLIAPYPVFAIENVLYEDVDPNSTSPKLLYLGKTKFPIKARQKKLCGWVDVRINVSAKGGVSSLVIEDSSNTVFEAMTKRAVERSFFIPVRDQFGEKVPYQGKLIRLVYTHRKGCPEGDDRDPKINPYLASHCMKIISSDPTGEVADYYVKNKCPYPIEAVACVNSNNIGRGYCKQNFIEPKKRGYIKFGFVYSKDYGKVSKYGFACRVEDKNTRRLVKTGVNKLRGQVFARCRTD